MGMDPDRGIDAGDAGTQGYDKARFLQVTPDLEELGEPGRCCAGNNGIAVILIAVHIDMAVRINHASSLPQTLWVVSIPRLALAEGYGMIGPHITATLTSTEEQTSCRGMLL